MRFFGAGAFVPIVAAALWLSACAESSVLPAAPSPLPVDKIGRLGIACPAGSQAQSFDGGPVTVHFGAPVPSGGQQPVTVGCTPHSGSAFGIGSTEVTCAASDALQQTANCAFDVTILDPPKLAVTRFLAFGDSITLGYVSPPVGRSRLISTSAYPFLLQLALALRYATQDIQVINAGKGGEQVAYAVGRFSAELRRHRPEVLLLMEGTNDLDVTYGAGLGRAAAALDRMVVAARAAAVDTIIMTIAPQRGTNEAPLVPSLNNRIRSIAARRGAVLVDVHHLLLTGPCNGVQPIPCMGNDGTHPTEQGYRLIAEELERVLVARYDVEILPAAGQQPGNVSPTGFFAERESVFLRKPRW